MSDHTFLDDLLTDTVLSRRSFLKWSAALGGTMALAEGGVAFGLEQAGTVKAEEAKTLASDIQIIPTGCAHNCGGRCQLIAWVQDGKIIRLESDPSPDTEEAPALRACLRGRAYRRRVYSADRLKYPMKRVGKRGEGKFERISWDEAATMAADQLKRIIDKYTNAALHLVAGSGGGSGTMGTGTAARLLNLMGGFVTTYNNYSWAATQKLSPYVYGVQETGSTRNSWLQSKLILMWGWNPAEMIDGTNTMWYVKEARKRGAKTIVIDPRLSMSGVGLADEWIPIRPGTDAAMMSAMAYVIITEKLHDQTFLDKYVVGFDAEHMPEGVEANNSYKDYILGTVDKQPKTPEWAEAITGVPRETIIRLAREFGSIKPAMLYQGYGIQRRAFGESAVFAGITLAVITGNVGVVGGHSSGIAFEPVGAVAGGFSSGKNPITFSVPRYKWHELMYRATEMTPEADGVVGLPKDVKRLPTNVKFLWEVAGQSLLNQHGNINLVASKLADESLVEFIIVQDQFMTPSAKYADLLLPACTWMETDGLSRNWKYGSTVINMPKVIEPLYESKSDYQIATLIADKLGLKDKYTEGKTEADWVKLWIQDGQKQDPNFPSYADFVKKGYYQRVYGGVKDGLMAFRADPEKNKLKTPSGKIELFSKTLFDMKKPDTIPAIAKYIPEWEGWSDPLRQKYPLMGITHHYMQRVHSTHDQLDWYEEAWPQRVGLNPMDAQARGIKDGDMVRVFNDRGQMVVPCHLTARIMPGVIDIPQGAWWSPDAKGIDRRGAVNVLTSDRVTPLAFGNPQGTFLVQVEKA